MTKNMKKLVLFISAVLLLTAGITYSKNAVLAADESQDYKYDYGNDGVSATIVNTEGKTLTFDSKADLLKLADGYDRFWIDIYEDTTLIVDGVKYLGPNSDAIYRITKNEGATIEKVGDLYIGKSNTGVIVVEVYGTATVNKVEGVVAKDIYTIFAQGNYIYNDYCKSGYVTSGSVHIKSLDSMPVGTNVGILNNGKLYNENGKLLAGYSSDAVFEEKSEDYNLYFAKLGNSNILTLTLAGQDKSKVNVNKYVDKLFIWEEDLKQDSENSLQFKSNAIYKKYVNYASKNVEKAVGAYFNDYYFKLKSSKPTIKAGSSYKLELKTSGPAVRYKKISGNSKITVSSTGKIKIGKGLKSGTYKLKVKVYAKDYSSINKTLTLNVKVKN